MKRLALLLLASCGPAMSSQGPGETQGSPADCPGDTVCSEPIDAGPRCARDEDCASGEACVKSTGRCVSAAAQTAAEPDAGRPPACQDGDVSSCGVSKLGECRLGSAICVLGAWGPCEGAVKPTLETCNGLDDDCDGLIDDAPGTRSCGVGACVRTVSACMSCTPGAPSTETCNGIDDDCDGTIDDGVCPPTAMCPAGRTVTPNTTVTLGTAASSARPLSCQWSIVSRPATSNGTFGSPTSCASSTYFADVVGTHTLKFTATDALGVSSSCTVDVVVNALGDLWIELTWDRNNDLDLHLASPGGRNMHTANGWAPNASPHDCYYGDTNPSWDAAGTADDPSLDRDDTSAKGPENIRINVPSMSHDYVIGVHNFGWAASPRTVNATVKLYCGNVLMTTRTYGFTKESDLWVVGKVRSGGTGACTFTPDGFVFNLP